MAAPDMSSSVEHKIWNEDNFQSLLGSLETANNEIIKGNKGYIKITTEKVTIASKTIDVVSKIELTASKKEASSIQDLSNLITSMTDELASDIRNDADNDLIFASSKELSRLSTAVTEVVKRGKFSDTKFFKGNKPPEDLVRNIDNFSKVLKNIEFKIHKDILTKKENILDKKDQKGVESSLSRQRLQSLNVSHLNRLNKLIDKQGKYAKNQMMFDRYEKLIHNFLPLTPSVKNVETVKVGKGITYSQEEGRVKSKTETEEVPLVKADRAMGGKGKTGIFKRSGKEGERSFKVHVEAKEKEGVLPGIVSIKPQLKQLSQSFMKQFENTYPYDMFPKKEKESGKKAAFIFQTITKEYVDDSGKLTISTKELLEKFKDAISKKYVEDDDIEQVSAWDAEILKNTPRSSAGLIPESTGKLFNPTITKNMLTALDDPKFTQFLDETFPQP